MKTFIKIILFSLICVGLFLGATSCSTTNISELVKASAQDTNTVTIKFTTIYGTLDYQRNPK